MSNLVIQIDQKGGMELQVKKNDQQMKTVRPPLHLYPETETHMTGVVSRFKIYPYHCTEVFQVVASKGFTQIVNGVLHYLPEQTGTETVTINGDAVISFEVVAPQPATPSLAAPIQDAWDVPKDYTFTSSAYVAPEGLNYIHTSTRWQLATDETFTTIVKDFTSTTDLTSTTVTGMLANTTYYMRCMYMAELS